MTETDEEIKAQDGQELIPAFKTDLEVAQFYAGSWNWLQKEAKKYLPKIEVENAEHTAVNR